jgi:hypothetical protein
LDIAGENKREALQYNKIIKAAKYKTLIEPKLRMNYYISMLNFLSYFGKSVRDIQLTLKHLSLNIILYRNNLYSSKILMNVTQIHALLVTLLS